MSTKPRTAVHAATVSRVLAQRFTKTSSMGSRVRGIRLVTDGFKVIKPAQWADEGRYVVVEHVAGMDSRVDADERIKRHNARIESYARVLREAGFATEVRRPFGTSPTANSVASLQNIIVVTVES